MIPTLLLPVRKHLNDSSFSIVIDYYYYLFGTTLALYSQQQHVLLFA